MMPVFLWVAFVPLLVAGGLDCNCTAKCDHATAACMAAPAVGNSSSCPSALNQIMKCGHDDAICQMVAFVSYGQNNTLLDNVLTCFQAQNCTYQMRDMSLLGPIEDHVGAQPNLTHLDYLDGLWWTVGATSFLDAIPCGSTFFQWSVEGRFWFNNETMRTSPDKFVHAYPQVTMKNGPGTWTTDYTTVGWAQVENFTVISKPDDYWMLVYYCGEDVAFGSYCGTMVMSRFRSFTGIPRWVNETFRARFSELNLTGDHGHSYDNLLAIDSLDCLSNSTPVAPTPWPEKFNTTFTAEFDFSAGDIWDSVMSYDYPRLSARMRHVRRRDGLACSYLFTQRLAMVVSDGDRPKQCCIDPVVPGVPTAPSMFHDFAEFRKYANYGDAGTPVALWDLSGSVTYAVSLMDGSTVYMQSTDFHGVWNFTGPFKAQTRFAAGMFDFPANCKGACDLKPSAQTNNCFFGSHSSVAAAFV